MKKLILLFYMLCLFWTAFAQEADCGHWVMADSLLYRKIQASTCLPSGNVLVSAHNNVVCQIYDYTVDKWMLTDSLSTERQKHDLVTLEDGRVLVTGGRYVNVNEIFDEGTGQWTLCDSFRLGARWLGTLTALKNGKALYVGGIVSGNISNCCELYDPITDTWTVVDSMKQTRYGHASIMLSDGRVVVTGGINDQDELLDSCEIFDPATNTWIDFPSMNTSHNKHEILLLNDDHIVVFSGSPTPDPKICEYFDWESGTWNITGRSVLPARKNCVKNLGDGYLLIISGTQWELISTSLLNTEGIIFSRQLMRGIVGLKLLPDGSVIAIGESGIFDDALTSTSACERYFPATTKVKDSVTKGIKSFELLQNYPNPFNPQTSIAYDLFWSCLVKLDIFNVNGRYIQTLINKKQLVGRHHVQFGASVLASGIYYYQLKTPDYAETKKMVKIK